MTYMNALSQQYMGRKLFDVFVSYETGNFALYQIGYIHYGHFFCLTKGGVFPLLHRPS